MIKRTWRGWTKPEDADAYEALLIEEIIPAIEGMGIEGYRGIQVLRRPAATGEIEFLTITTFKTLDAVKEFAGQEYHLAHVPPRARMILHRFEEVASHYEQRVSRPA